eukprot:m.278901 g.278901  ORF g.278901 m.278901 type:complete len:58 (-) comp16155_c0_seq29:2507-2680(-)
MISEAYAKQYLVSSLDFDAEQNSLRVIPLSNPPLVSRKFMSAVATSVSISKDPSISE